MLSLETAVRKYELWLIIPGQRSEQLNQYGMYESQREAERVAGAIADWFHLGSWYGSVLDRLSPECQDDLWAMRQGFKFDGTNLGAVRVKVRPVRNVATPVGPMLALHIQGDEEEDDTDDTDLHLPSILYLPAEG